MFCKLGSTQEIGIKQTFLNYLHKETKFTKMSMPESWCHEILVSNDTFWSNF